MWKQAFFLINVLTAFLIYPTYCVSIEDAEDIISLTTTVIKSIYRAWETFGPEDDHTAIVFETKHQKVLSSLDTITSMVQKVETDMPQTSAAMMNKLERDLLNNIRLNEKLKELVTLVRDVSSAYDTFRDLQSHSRQTKSAEFTSDDNHSTAEALPYESYTLEKFSELAVSFVTSSVRKKVELIHEMIIPRQDTTIQIHHESVFSIIRDNYKGNLHCVLNQSLQQTLYNLFSCLRITQLKGLIVLQYSYMILRLHGKGSFVREKQAILSSFEGRFKNQVKTVKLFLDTSDNSFWRCDPDEHIRDVTYTELTKLLQGYIRNENDLSRDHTCYDGCEYHKYVEHYSCTKGAFCEIQHQQECKGKVMDCKHIGNNLGICSSDDINRRYDSITSLENKKVYGKSYCSSSNNKKAEYWRKILVFWKCTYCLCICDDQDSLLSDRYFNLKEYTSDILENKVVTGVRFRKHNRIIHLQIRQGVLQTKGIINNVTQEWVPLAEYVVKTGHSDSPDVGIPGKDYYVLNYTHRAIDLDDLKAPPHHVVTGVRFRVLGVHLNLEIRVTPFVLETGVLRLERSQWVSNDNTDVELPKPRKQFRLPSTKLPTELVISEIDAKSDSYLEFTYSDKDTDVSQSTVPFLDIQPVSPNPPVPLSGIGLSHKGTEWTAGFIALKVFTYNVEERLDSEKLDDIKNVI